MSNDFDFDLWWLEKLSREVDHVAGAEVRDQILQGSEGLSSASDRREVIAWTQGVMEMLETLVPGEDDRQTVMCGCACHYPPEGLAPIRQAYENSGDLDLAQAMLQQQFESMLRDQLALPEDMVQEVIRRGWGSAGVRHGNTILATKIPKSGYLRQYLEEQDLERRRQLYCHCPRVRDALALGMEVPPLYCYCGAGFYQNIWETILGVPVQVEVLRCVLAGDDVCTVAIRLPSGR